MSNRTTQFETWIEPELEDPDEIAERVRFMAAVQQGLDELERGAAIPHEEVKKQLASWLTG